jgi:hypothetical protein
VEEDEAKEEGEKFSDELEAWLKDDSPKTLGALGEVFAEKSFAVTILLLMFVPALPAPTGGITHVFEVIVVLLSLQMIIGRREIWLPQRWQRRELGALTTGKALPFIVRRVRTFERISRPRWAHLLEMRMMVHFFGLVFLTFAVGALLAPPFSGLDTLPALGAVVVALGIILEDVLIVGIGGVIGLGGVALILTVGATLVRIIKDWI